MHDKHGHPQIKFMSVHNYPYHLAFKYTLFLLFTIVYTILMNNKKKN